jgi:dTDP-4-dehydrorhamnose reductase
VRVLVTGANGQIARSLVECGEARGDSVIALGRAQLDLAAPESLDPAVQAARPDVIVNAAAYTAVDTAEQEPMAATLVNAIGAGQLASCARKFGLPIVHLSTDYVFDGRQSRPYTEQDAVAPLGAYGRSKAAGERAVAAATSDHAIIRTAWVYSSFGRNFVDTMLRLARTRSPIRVVADQHGAPSYAIDVAEGILTVAQNLIERRSEPARRGVFHMTATGATTWADFATLIFDLAAQRGGPSAEVEPVTTSEYAAAAPRPANSCLDCSKLARIHGVVLPPWQTSLAACIARLLPVAH